MERDAIYSGPGSLPNRAEIKILICYILSSINEPVPETELTQVLHYEGISNYFDASEAISELIKSECIKLKDDGFTVTPKGREVSETLKQSVARSVREKAITVVTKMMARIRHERDTDISIKKVDGGYSVEFSIIEQGRNLMSLGLTVADESSANFIKERILDDPSYIYAGLIELLTDQNINYKREDIIKP